MIDPRARANLDFQRRTYESYLRGAPGNTRALATIALNIHRWARQLGEAPGVPKPTLRSLGATNFNGQFWAAYGALYSYGEVADALGKSYADQLVRTGYLRNTVTVVSDALVGPPGPGFAHSSNVGGLKPGTYELLPGVVAPGGSHGVVPVAEAPGSPKAPRTGKAWLIAGGLTVVAALLALRGRGE